MTSDAQGVFADGHDRLQWDIQESNFRAVKVDPKEMAVTAPKATSVAQAQAVEPVLPPPMLPMKLLNQQHRLPTCTIAETSLRRWSKMHAVMIEAIKARNERIKQTKQQARNRYGW